LFTLSNIIQFHTYFTYASINIGDALMFIPRMLLEKSDEPFNYPTLDDVQTVVDVNGHIIQHIVTMDAHA
jgi:hypothetical protein